MKDINMFKSSCDFRKIICWCGWYEPSNTRSKVLFYFQNKVRVCVVKMYNNKENELTKKITTSQCNILYV